MTLPIPIPNTILSSLVLIVDDADFSLHRLQATLRKYGFNNVVCAEDGQEALEFIEKSTPQMVITDWIMQRMDGYALCKYIRSKEGLKHLPILIQTGSDIPREFFRMFEAGATDMIRKPTPPEALISKIVAYLEAQQMVVRHKNE